MPRSFDDTTLISNLVIKKYALSLSGDEKTSIINIFIRPILVPEDLRLLTSSEYGTAFARSRAKPIRLGQRDIPH